MRGPFGMKRRPTRAIAAALLASSMPAGAEAQPATPSVGEEREIVRSYETSVEGGSGSSRSSGRDTLLERILAVRDDGLELEYDLPKGATAEERGRNWQFPARVFKPFRGPAELINGAELGSRAESWPKAAGLSSEVCGRWVFTWNAFKIACDPQSVVTTLQAYDLWSIKAGEEEAYEEPNSRQPGTLRRTDSGPDGDTYTTLLPVDPDSVRRSRAEADVAVAEMMRKALPLEAALRDRAGESVSGTIATTIETEASGRVRRRTRTTRLEILGANGVREISTETVNVTSRGASGR